MKPHDQSVHLISIARMNRSAESVVSQISFRGSVREKTLEPFRSFLEQAGGRSPFLTVNFAEVDYMCSAGLGMLLRQSGIQEEQGGWLRVVDPSPTVKMILDLSGVSSAIPVLTGKAAAEMGPPAKAA